MTGDDIEVQILLACYNGSDYISELLESIADQNYTDWHMLIRDDGSSDTTVEIVSEFAEKFPGRVRLVDTLQDAERNLGPKGNFAKLLSQCTGRYIMFADQDDVWMPDKISRSLSAMQRAEAKYGDNTPVLIHSDLTVVDSKLEKIAESFWDYQKLDPDCQKFSRLLVANNVTGCATMVNRPLVDIAGDIPPEAVMHDWWLALCASAFGKIALARDKTILYRQHGTNDTGAKNFTGGYVLAQAASFSADDGLAFRLQRAQKQALKFAATYKDKLNDKNFNIAHAYGMIAQKGFLARRLTLLRCGLLMHGRGIMPWIKNIGLMLRI